MRFFPAFPLQELVAHLAGARALELAPRQPRLERRGRLDIDAGARREPRRQPLHHRRQGILPERRIEENHVEAVFRLLQIVEGIAEHELYPLRAKQVSHSFKRSEDAAVIFRHHHPRGTARGGLEAERAAAGKEVEAGEAVEPLAEPVEQRLAHAVRRRAQIGPGRHGDAAAAVFPGNNSNSPFVRMHRSMVAALSWAARLKAGLARTREVLDTPIGELLARRRVDESLYEALEAALLQADCGVEAAQTLVASLRSRKLEDGEALKRALKDAIAELLLPLEKKLEITAKPYAIMIAGVNGSGKTTSIGKLARWLQLQGRSVLLAAGDTWRAAAREQLVAWGERNAVPVIAQQSGDPGAVVFDALGAARGGGTEVVIADTAGRLPTQLHLMEEIRKVKRVAAKAQAGAPHEVLLVLDANTGQNALVQVRAFDDALGLTGLVLTKLDGTAKGGVVCAIARERPVPLLFVGVGEDIDDLRPFVARDFAEALVG